MLSRIKDKDKNKSKDKIYYTFLVKEYIRDLEKQLIKENSLEQYCCSKSILKYIEDETIKETTRKYLKDNNIDYVFRYEEVDSLNDLFKHLESNGLNPIMLFDKLLNNIYFTFPKELPIKKEYC